MPLRITAASSSSNRVNKSGRRASASPFSTAKRRKPLSKSSRNNSTQAEDEDESFGTRLADEGLVASLADDLNFSDVAQLLVYIANHQFTPMPESGAGMNSTRIAEVLNFRARLPPIVSVAHVHAMSKSPTTTEREIATLINAGVIRRLVLPGRGERGPAVGEGLVLVSEWEKLVQADSTLPQEVKDRYISFLRDPSLRPTFTPAEITSLSTSGLVTRSATASTNAEVFLRPGPTTLGSLKNVATAGSVHASGSFGAVAGSSTAHISGGSGASSRLSTSKAASSTPYGFSLPNTGPYLKMLMEARAHLVSLLGKTNKYREAPRDMLKERWDGGIAGTDEAAKAQRARGEWKGVLPGRTKKWKQFHGLEFQWVLEECLGAGMVECFKTGSVGVGVRAV
jgi:hypothetical protein